MDLQKQHKSRHRNISEFAKAANTVNSCISESAEAANPSTKVAQSCHAESKEDDTAQLVISHKHCHLLWLRFGLFARPAPGLHWPTSLVSGAAVGTFGNVGLAMHVQPAQVNVQAE